MKTRGDAMTSDAETVLARIKTLGSSSFSRPDLAELIEPFTSRLEYFLKAVVFPSASRRTKLHQLIEDLLGLGLSAQDVSALHRLRELYNKSKHDCQRRYKMGPATGLKVGQSIQTKSLSLRLGLIGVGEAAVA